MNSSLNFEKTRPKKTPDVGKNRRDNATLRERRLVRKQKLKLKGVA